MTNRERIVRLELKVADLEHWLAEAKRALIQQCYPPVLDAKDYDPIRAWAESQADE